MSDYWKTKKKFFQKEEEQDEPENVVHVVRGPRGPAGPPGPPGHGGEPGKSPSLEEFISLIKSLLPSKERLINLIKPLIPKPIPGPKGKPGKSIVGPPGRPGESGKIYTAEEIRDMLENLKQKLSINAIAELPEILEKLSKAETGKIGLLKGSIHARKGQEVRFIDDETPSGTKNGVNADFVLAKNPKAGSVKVYRNGARQRVTEDYTLSGKTITFTVAPQSAEIILCDYRY